MKILSSLSSPWIEGIHLCGYTINFSSLSLLRAQLSPLEDLCMDCCLWHTQSVGEIKAAMEPSHELWLWTHSGLPPLGDVHATCCLINLGGQVNRLSSLDSIYSHWWVFQKVFQSTSYSSTRTSGGPNFSLLALEGLRKTHPSFIPPNFSLLPEIPMSLLPSNAEPLSLSVRRRRWPHCHNWQVAVYMALFRGKEEAVRAPWHVTAQGRHVVWVSHIRY